jgi:hypothetical protein
MFIPVVWLITADAQYPVPAIAIIMYILIHLIQNLYEYTQCNNFISIRLIEFRDPL